MFLANSSFPLFLLFHSVYPPTPTTGPASHHAIKHLTWFDLVIRSLAWHEITTFSSYLPPLVLCNHFLIYILYFANRQRTTEVDDEHQSLSLMPNFLRETNSESELAKISNDNSCYLDPWLQFRFYLQLSFIGQNVARKIKKRRIVGQTDRGWVNWENFRTFLIFVSLKQQTTDMKGEGMLWGNFLEFPDSEESKIELVHQWGESLWGNFGMSVALFGVCSRKNKPSVVRHLFVDTLAAWNL